MAKAGLMGILKRPLAAAARLAPGGSRRRAEVDVAELGAAREAARTAMATRDAAVQTATAATRLLDEQKARALAAEQRVRSLERILNLASRLSAARSLNELLDEVAGGVREALGFRMVLLRIWSPSTQAFEARAFAGISEEGKAHLSTLQVSLEQYRRMTQARFRISQSYFISHKDEGWAEATEGGYTPDLGARGEDEWNENDMLIVPLLALDGDARGYLSVDDPTDRRVPSLDVIRQLELLAGQASAAIGSAELYDRLARNNLELSRASALLKNLNDMKSNFVANVSHELRTPLTSIKAYTETLVHNHGAMNEAVRDEFLSVIHQESEKLTQIIDNILDLARAEDGRLCANRLDSDLVAIIRAAAEASRPQAEAKGIDLRLDLPDAGVRLRVDPDQIAQVIQQLLDNACKFTPADGAIRLALSDALSTVRIAVEDTGIGIPEEKMEYIFDRFYQVDGSSTREHGGQGVGLAICRDIVSWHEGRIWAENRRPRGVRFLVELPRRDAVVVRTGPDVNLPEVSDPQEFLEKLIHWIGESLRVRNVSLMLPDDGGDHLIMAAAVGLPESVVENIRLRRGEGIAGKVWSSGRALLVPDVTQDSRFGKKENDGQYVTPSLLSVPLFDGLDCVGVLNVNNRVDGRPFTEDDRVLLEALAPRVTYLLARSAACREHSREHAAMREAMSVAISVRRERYDELSAECHGICLAAARRLKLPQEDLENLAFALQSYDVGLARLSGQLLRKSAPLGPEESALIRQHPHGGLEILAPLAPTPKVRQIIVHHHERYDGAGYPDGLEGEAIPVGARLLGLTDSLNAMLQGRPYRRPLPLDEALAAIEKGVGTQFCPRLAPPFLAEAREQAARIAVLQASRAELDEPAPEAPVGVAGDVVSSGAAASR